MAICNACGGSKASLGQWAYYMRHGKFPDNMCTCKPDGTRTRLLTPEETEQTLEKLKAQHDLHACRGTTYCVTCGLKLKSGFCACCHAVLGRDWLYCGECGTRRG